MANAMVVAFYDLWVKRLAWLMPFGRVIVPAIILGCLENMLHCFKDRYNNSKLLYKTKMFFVYYGSVLYTTVTLLTI